MATLVTNGAGSKSSRQQFLKRTGTAGAGPIQSGASRLARSADQADSILPTVRGLSVVHSTRNQSNRAVVIPFVFTAGAGTIRQQALGAARQAVAKLVAAERESRSRAVRNA